MGSSQKQKADNHDRLLAIAAKEFRSKGLDGLSVAQLMSAAGLTHGGFYTHFASREALVAEALDRAFDDARRDLFREFNPKRGNALETFIATYLSPMHRNDPGRGCVLATLSTDVKQSDEETRTVYTNRFKTYVGEIAELIGDDDKEDASAQAMAILSILAGAVIISRALSNDSLSRKVLRSAHNLLSQWRAAKRSEK
jgi:TetR/AcrR family transcriptional regulator, transcriptional repressor for nem operon